MLVTKVCSGVHNALQSKEALASPILLGGLADLPALVPVFVLFADCRSLVVTSYAGGNLLVALAAFPATSNNYIYAHKVMRKKGSAFPKTDPVLSPKPIKLNCQ